MIWAGIKTFLSGPFWRALSSIDYRIWLAVGFLLAMQIHGCTSYNRGFSAGETAVLDKLREAEAKAVTRSLEAAAKADAVAAQKAEERAEVIAGQIAAIEQAERDGRSAVDSVMNWGK
jgi:hypothetical protein